jgi:hypothetical protein
MAWHDALDAVIKMERLPRSARTALSLSHLWLRQYQFLVDAVSLAFVHVV